MSTDEVVMEFSPPVRLPHTGLRLPDRRLSITRYKQVPGGAGFTAWLRVDGLHAGVIEGDHDGRLRTFAPTDPAGGWVVLAQYAARCRTGHGGELTVKRLLEDLVTETLWARHAGAAERAGRLLLRLLDHVAGPDGVRADHPSVQGRADSAMPRSIKQWKELAALLRRTMPPGRHGWWQGWTNSRWRDVTAPPDGVPAGPTDTGTEERR